VIGAAEGSKYCADLWLERVGSLDTDRPVLSRVRISCWAGLAFGVRRGDGAAIVASGVQNADHECGPGPFAKMGFDSKAKFNCSHLFARAFQKRTCVRDGTRKIWLNRLECIDALNPSRYQLLLGNGTPSCHRDSRNPSQPGYFSHAYWSLSIKCLLIQRTLSGDNERCPTGAILEAHHVKYHVGATDNRCIEQRDCPKADSAGGASAWLLRGLHSGRTANDRRPPR
jgi:hypothetical protein